MNKESSGSTLQKARQYAFYLLKFRLRSENEIYSRLEKKKFEREIIRQTVAFLKEKRFIDDAEFARAWVESRIKKPLGLRRLREELKLKGVAKEIIDNQLERIKKDYSEIDVVREIARVRFSKLSAIEPQRAKMRIYAYLLRHGFSPGIVIDVINNL